MFADDEAHLRDLMQMELPRLGHEVTVCPDGTAALRALERGLVRRRLARHADARNDRHRGPGPDQQISPDTQVIILTGHATVDTAVQALRLGAFDYLTKPCKWAELEVILQPRRRTPRPGQQDHGPGDPAQGRRGSAAADRRDAGHAAGPPPDRHDRAHRCHRHDPGRDRHRQGAGRAQPPRQEPTAPSRAFIPVNCGALPENLVESELFGHRKGAFTGADTNRKGLFEVANGGTLFLDEVGELDKSVQVKLLRFLESGEIRRVGENEPFRVDVRVLCATNRDLRDMVAERAVPRGPVLPAQYVRDLPARPCATARPTSPRWRSTCSPATRRGGA